MSAAASVAAVAPTANGTMPLSRTVKLTSQIAAVAMNGRLASGSPEQIVRGFSIDTRTLAPGDLFFAIEGERFDGHDFVATAFERGALGAVVSGAIAAAVSESGAEPTLIVVDDTTRALQRLARFVRRESGTRVVAITGSAGKTTTKEIAAALLSARYQVFRNRGNLNNHIGLPLSLLELRNRPEIAVVELGMNHAGEIRTLVSIAEPELRVWTNVGEVHAEFFDSIEAIADAKAEILEGATPESVVVANAGDPRVMARVHRFAGRVITFGVETPADVAAWQVRDHGLSGVEAVIRTPGGVRAVRSPLPGRANLANLLAGIAVAVEMNVPIDDIAAKAGTLRPATNRGEVVRLPEGITILDDSYNSNPAALRAALDVIRAEAAGRRVAVLGEMLELGERSLDLHRESGDAAAGVVDVLITVGGPAAEEMAAAAIAGGLPASAVRHVATSAEAAEWAARLVRPGDLVLVKGSRGVRTEVVVERLKAELG